MNNKAANISVFQTLCKLTREQYVRKLAIRYLSQNYDHHKSYHILLHRVYRMKILNPSLGNQPVNEAMMTPTPIICINHKNVLKSKNLQKQFLHSD